ncbi:MAG: endonuclease III [Steroidobacteraceae bacterium]
MARRRIETLLTADARRQLFERLRAVNPRPRSELSYRSPYQLLISVILSAQATDRSVNLATKRLFRVAATPRAMLELGEVGLAAHIRTIGLWRVKARHIIAASRLLIERHGGRVPRERAALEALPGVGRKTANVVMNTAFGAPTIAVDTHIFRVANRTGLAPGRNVREVEDRLLMVVPEEFRADAHHGLILHGRYVCKARRPACPGCLIADLCRYPNKTAAA